MKRQTTVRERQAFYERHQAGKTYAEIAQADGVSLECVRYWCRRQQAGGPCQSQYHRQAAGLLSGFDPLVRYSILRLKLAHPRWGPQWLRYHLTKRSSLRGLKLPSPSAMGRYLHRWSRFRRQRQKKAPDRPRPHQPTAVPQQWQIDFKTDLKLQDGSGVSLHTIRDPVGEACLNAVIFPTEKVKPRPQRVSLEQVRTVLRRCFAQWHTLPDEIQTDGEPVLVAPADEAFPSPFTLWLAGLGVSHQVIRAGKPTDNAEVERCHRTITDYALVGNEDKSLAPLQLLLDQAVTELLCRLLFLCLDPTPNPNSHCSLIRLMLKL